jgi:molybdopterin converting factor small subunit
VVHSEPANSDVTLSSVRVRYFAGARAAAGRDEETIHLPADTTVRNLVVTLCKSHGERLARVLAAASFLLDGIAVRDDNVTVKDGMRLDVLPPFAGG